MYASKLPGNVGLPIVQRLLSQKAILDISVPADSLELPVLLVGYTALFFAAAKGNDLVVEALLATNKVDIKQVDALGKIYYNDWFLSS